MKNVFILILLQGVLLLSCSQKEGITESKIEVTVGNIITSGLAPFVDGGAILYGQNDTTGDRFSINLIDAPENFTIPLTNGNWVFFGLLWDDIQAGGAGKFEGKPYCAFTSATLTGGSTTLPINFSNTNCSNSIFTSLTDTGSGYNQFPALTLKSCNTLTNISAQGNFCDNSISRDRGYIRSYKVVLPTYILGNINAPTGAPLESDCILTTTGTAQNNSTTANGTVFIPGGDGNLPLETEIHAFFGGNCDPSKGVDIYNFDHGIGTNLYGGKIKSFTSATDLTVFHKLSGEEVCSISPVDHQTDFSTGDGTSVTPYGICSAIQWETISKNSGNLSNHFEILQDIDFSERAAGFPASTSPLDPDCVGFGSTFIPIGYQCVSSALTVLGSGSFDASFFGNNKTLKNMFFIPDSQSLVGIFSQIGSSSAVNIQGLKVENLRLEGSQFVGGLAGRLGSASGSYISNIHFKNLNIVSRFSNPASATGTDDANIGGLLGESTSPGPNISSIIIERAKIRASDSRVGGIVGSINSVTFPLTQAYFDGYIKLNQNDSTTSIEKIGGIIGLVDSPSSAFTISQVAAKGAIVGRIKYTGGIIGYNSGSNYVTVDNSKSEMAIATTHDPTVSPLYLGGVVGYTTATSLNVTKNLFTGSLYSRCTGTCKISEAVGGGGSMAAPDVLHIRNYSGAYGGIQSVGGTQKTSSSLQDGSSNPIDTNYWTLTNGAYPNLTWIVSSLGDDCDQPQNLQSIANQVDNLARGGSADNPVLICNTNQFWDIENDSSYYKLANHLNVYEHFLSSTDGGISLFSGNFNGDDHIISGMDISSADPSTVGETGLFKKITSSGQVHHLDLVGLRTSRSNSDPTNFMGTLAGINEGDINHINGYALSSLGYDAVKTGGLVGQTSGTMNNIILEAVEMLGANMVGGLAAHSTGSGLSKIYVDSSFHIPPPVSSGYSKIGGILGASFNTELSEAAWGGRIEISHTNSSFPSTQIGGLIGLADSTSIENSYSAQYAQIIINDGSNVGGLVGELSNTSIISKSYSASEVRYGFCDDGSPDYDTCILGSAWNNPSSTATYGPLVGQKSSSTIDGDSYFSTKAYSLVHQLSSNFSISWNATYSKCELDTTAASVSLTSSPPLEIFLDSHSEYYPIVDYASAGSFKYLFDLDQTLCSTSNSVTIVDPGSTNLDGIITLEPDFYDIATFCPSVTLNDPDFRCSSGWDAIERGASPTSVGFNYVVESYAAMLMGQSPPADIPIWEVGDDDFPRHFWRMD